MHRNQKNHIESPCGLSLLFLFWSHCVTMELGLVFRNTLSHILHYLSRIFISHFYLAFLSHIFLSRIFYLAFFSCISHFYLASRILSRMSHFYLAFLSRIYLHNFFPLLLSRISNVPYRLPYINVYKQETSLHHIISNNCHFNLKHKQSFALQISSFFLHTSTTENTTHSLTRETFSLCDRKTLKQSL